MPKETIFNVRSQKAYDKLMKELSGRAVWFNHEGYCPTAIDHFYKGGRDTLIFIQEGFILYGSIEDYTDLHFHIFKPSDSLDDDLQIVKKNNLK